MNTRMSDLVVVRGIHDDMSAFDVGAAHSVDECEKLAIEALRSHDKELLTEVAERAVKWTFEKYPDDLDTSDERGIVNYITKGLVAAIMGEYA